MDRLSFLLNWNFIVDTLWTAHHRSAESFRHISLDSTSIFLSADLYCHKPLNLASIFRRLFHGFSRRIFIRRVHLPLHLSVKLLSRPAFTLTLYWNLPHSSFSITNSQMLLSFLLQLIQWDVHLLWCLHDKKIVFSDRYSTPRCINAHCRLDVLLHNIWFSE